MLTPCNRYALALPCSLILALGCSNKGSTKQPVIQRPSGPTAPGVGGTAPAPPPAPGDGGATVATGGDMSDGSGGVDPRTGGDMSGAPGVGAPPDMRAQADMSPHTSAGDMSTVVTVRPPRHHRCGWIGGDNPDGGAAAFAANIDFFDAIHPVWFGANADGTISANSHVDDPRVVTVARAHGVLLMPLVYGGDDPSIVRNIMSSQANINNHVNALVNLVVSRGYDGIDEDYEHLWQASDRPGFIALNKALAAALHAKGKQLSLAMPPMTVDNGGSAYADVTIVQNGADILHLMGYDFHSTDTDHLGPQAPLGWLDAVAARMKSVGIADHTIMGLANYGIGSGWYTIGAAAAITKCGGSYLSTTTHMQTCPYGTFTAGTSPHCTTSQGDLWFEDATSIAEKSRNAASHGLRGITFYTLGGEPPGFYDALRAGYPQ